MLKELKINLENDLNKSLITSSSLLDNLSIMNEDSRKSSAYVDSKNIPFFYYFGKYFKSTNLIEVGTGAALHSSVYLKGNQNKIDYLGFQQKTEEFYSVRFAKKNISKFTKNFEIHHGNITDDYFQQKLSKIKWNLAFFNELDSYDKTLFKMTEIWKHLDFNSIFLVNHVNSNEIIKKCLSNFSKINNVPYEIISTRYGVGLIQK